MRLFDLILNSCSALAAGIPAIFWFQSAMVMMPEPDVTCGGSAGGPGASMP
jgi:hypothetical protein